MKKISESAIEEVSGALANILLAAAQEQILSKGRKHKNAIPMRGKKILHQRIHDCDGKK